MVLITLLKKAIQSFFRNNDTNKAAALSYYMLFSIAPLLFLIVNMVRIFYDTQTAQGQINGQLQAIVGKESAKLLNTMIAHTYNPQDTLIGTIIGSIGIVLSSIGIINHLRESLKDIWNIKVSKKNIFNTINEYLLSFFLLIVTGTIFLLSFIISTSLAALGRFVGDVFPVPLGTIESINVISLFVVLGLLCSILFKFLPPTHTEWKESLLGGFFTSILLGVSKFAISFYIGKVAPVTPFGASGSLVLLLLWIYFSSNIFFLGAEFTRRLSSPKA